MFGMERSEIDTAIGHVASLVEEHYVDQQTGAAISRAVASSLAAGRYPEDGPALAEAVTADLQSVNGDKHLRLIYHAEALAERTSGGDAEEYAAMARWAGQTCGGVARVELLPENVGLLDLQPVLFPAAISGDAITAAMTLLRPTRALIIDVRHCIGGEPGMVALICSYLFDPDPVELSGMYERKHDRVRQAWTLPVVPGPRYGTDKRVFVLTSAATFSGAEHLAYDLQQRGRATIVGEGTRGGANPRESFRIQAHLDATISVARSVSPITGGNWEGTGVTPDAPVQAEMAREHAHQLALDHLAASGA
jgi:Peptidase family S41/N-terminal domain of Peptidase_S41 in eukaryotic IRBP